MKVRFAPAQNPGFRATVGWVILETAEPGATGGRVSKTDVLAPKLLVKWGTNCDDFIL